MFSKNEKRLSLPDEYKIGIKIIDTQHGRLFNLIDHLQQVRNHSDGSGGMVQKALAELEDYLRVHFATEEEIMRIHNYPHYEEHKLIHKEFWDNVCALRRDCESGNLVLLSSMVMILIQWVKSHIKDTDKELGTFLKRAGLG